MSRVEFPYPCDGKHLLCVLEYTEGEHEVAAMGYSGAPAIMELCSVHAGGIEITDLLSEGYKDLIEEAAMIYHETGRTLDRLRMEGAL